MPVGDSPLMESLCYVLEQVSVFRGFVPVQPRKTRNRSDVTEKMLIMLTGR